VFSTFNNLIGGVYLALMDPYGLTLFDAQTWGFALAFSSTGFLIGGAVVAVRARCEADAHHAAGRDGDGAARRDLHAARVVAALRRRHVDLHGAGSARRGSQGRP
jgi:threonine aldolase